MGEVGLARTSPTLHPPSPPTLHQLSRLALSELKEDCCLLTSALSEAIHVSKCTYTGKSNIVITVSNEYILGTGIPCYCLCILMMK